MFREIVKNVHIFRRDYKEGGIKVLRNKVLRVA